jgi:hypothetical protein
VDGDIFRDKGGEEGLAPQRPDFRRGDDEEGALIAGDAVDAARERVEQSGLDEDGVVCRCGGYGDRSHAVFHRIAEKQQVPPLRFAAVGMTKKMILRDARI